MVAINNYRAWGGKCAGTGEKYIAFASPDEHRPVVSAWISAQTQAQGGGSSTGGHNWRLAPVHSDIPLDIRFETSPSPKAAGFIVHYGCYPLRYIRQVENGFTIYRIDLQR